MLNLMNTLIFFTAFSIINHMVNADKANQNANNAKNSTAKINRILEGELSNQRDYRYMVSIMRLVNDYPELTCGGAIIHRRYVLSAAHCVSNYRSHDLVVRHIGQLKLDEHSPQNENRSFHQVVKTFIPMVYSSLPCRKHHNDIAVLKVEQIFDLTDFVRYAKVNLPEFDAEYDGQFATIAGYGPDYAPLKEEQNQKKEEQDGKKRYLQYVHQLRAMHTTVISNEECQYYANVVLTEGSICAKALNPDSQTCFEDDGGPLVHEGTVIGILNDRRCDFKVPELFTRVSAYLHFIKTVMEHQLSYDIRVL